MAKKFQALIPALFPEEEAQFWQRLFDSAPLSIFISQLILVFREEQRYLPREAAPLFEEAARCSHLDAAYREITPEYRIERCEFSPCPRPSKELKEAGYRHLQERGREEDRAIPFEEYDIEVFLDEEADVARLDFLPKIPPGLSWMDIGMGGPGMTIYITLTQHDLIQYWGYR